MHNKNLLIDLFANICLFSVMHYDTYALCILFSVMHYDTYALCILFSVMHYDTYAFRNKDWGGVGEGRNS